MVLGPSGVTQWECLLNAEPASTPDDIPEPLRRTLETLDDCDEDERAEYLMGLSDDFREPPDSVAVRPYPEYKRVPNCESEAYFWAKEREDGTLDFYFAVENPQGISARAVGAIMAETLSGQTLKKVSAVRPDIVDRMFGRRLSMGKGEGLRGMVGMAVREAKKRLSETGSTYS